MKNFKLLIFICVIVSTSPLVADVNNEDVELSSREQEIKKLSTITITADPLAPSLLEYGSAISHLEAEQIKPLAETSLGETLSLEPGVFSSFGGPASSRPVIRGFAGERVRVLRSGVGSLDVSNTSEDHSVTINPLAIESVEILRGPETLLYGSSAIGGVVNTTDNSIPEKAIGRELGGSFDLRTRTNDDELSGALMLEGQKGSFNWHLNSFHTDSDNYKIPVMAESKRQIEFEESQEAEHLHEEDHDHALEESSSDRLANSFSTTKGFTAGSSYVTDRGFFGVAFNGFKSRYGIPGGHSHGEEEDHHDEDLHFDGAESIFDHDDHESEFASETESGAVVDLTQYRIDTRGRIKNPINAFKDASMKLSFSNYDHSESEGGEVATRYSNDAVEGRVEARHKEVYGFKGSVGLQGEYSDFGSKGEEAFIPSSKRYAPAAFIYESIPLVENLKFEGGSRIEHVSLDPELVESRNFTPFSVSAGLLYDPTGDSTYTISLSSAYTERAPSASELFANGAHFARQIFESGDIDLDKENSYGLDLAFKKNSGLFTGGVNLFAQRYERFINLSATGEVEDGFDVYQYSDVPALFTGVEIENTFHLHEALGLYSHDLDLGAQVDYVRARNTSDYSDIPRIPPLRTILRARYGYKDLLSATVEGVFANHQSDVASNELQTDSYQVLNAQFDLHVPYVKESLGKNYLTSFYVRGTNLTDEEVRYSTSFIKDFAPQRGRAILFGIRTLF